MEKVPRGNIYRVNSALSPRFRTEWPRPAVSSGGRATAIRDGDIKSVRQPAPGCCATTKLRDACAGVGRDVASIAGHGTSSGNGPVVRGLVVCGRFVVIPQGGLLARLQPQNVGRLEGDRMVRSSSAHLIEKEHGDSTHMAVVRHRPDGEPVQRHHPHGNLVVDPTIPPDNPVVFLDAQFITAHFGVGDNGLLSWIDSGEIPVLLTM